MRIYNGLMFIHIDPYLPFFRIYLFIIFTAKMLISYSR